MNRRFFTVSFVALVWLVAGCAKKPAAPAARMNAMITDVSLDSSSEYAIAGVAAAEPGRFVAERHKLEVATSEADVQKSWEATVAFCGTIRCEVVSSTIMTRAGTTDPSGAITLRVAPDDFPKLLGQVQHLGQITSHTTQRDDRTTQVIDTEAKLKNLTTFRDNLRAMLRKPSATVKDLVEIQQQLTETQSQLDSETANRKFLTNETEKVRVEIGFRVARSGETSGAFSEIRNALRDSGSVLADSTASLITFIVATIPWLVLIVPAVWLVARFVRRLRKNRRPAQTAAAGETLAKS